MDVNQTYCGGHFAVERNIESLCCTPETNITLYVIIPQKINKIKGIKNAKINQG